MFKTFPVVKNTDSHGVETKGEQADCLHNKQSAYANK